MPWIKKRAETPEPYLDQEAIELPSPPRDHFPLEDSDQQTEDMSVPPLRSHGASDQIEDRPWPDDNHAHNRLLSVALELKDYLEAVTTEKWKSKNPQEEKMIMHQWAENLLRSLEGAIDEAGEFR